MVVLAPNLKQINLCFKADLPTRAKGAEVLEIFARQPRIRQTSSYQVRPNLGASREATNLLTQGR
jgi:hypothetical protein